MSTFTVLFLEVFLNALEDFLFFDRNSLNTNTIPFAVWLVDEGMCVCKHKPDMHFWNTGFYTDRCRPASLLVRCVQFLYFLQ